MAVKTRRIFVKDVQVQASIGIYEHEKLRRQTLRVSFEAEVSLPNQFKDDVPSVVSYELFRDAAHSLAGGKHINLVETFADLLLEQCVENARILALIITVEKTDVFPDAESAGVVVNWRRDP